MGKLSKACVGLGLLLTLFATPVYAQGVGTYDAGVTCGKYLADYEHRQTESMGYQLDMVYADGYLSGVNLANHFNPDHVSTMIGGSSSVASRGLAFYEYCKSHPQGLYLNAIEAFIHRYWNRVPYPH